MIYEDPDRPWKVKHGAVSLAECRTEEVAQELCRQMRESCGVELEIWLDPREDTTRRWSDISWGLIMGAGTVRMEA